MSGAAMKWARRQKLPTTALKSMLNAIAARADEKGKTWVSQATLAEDMSCSDRNVRRLLAALEYLGVIGRTVRSTGRKGRISDEISLPLHRDFNLSKSALPTGQRLPVRVQVSNRTKSAVPTGQRLPGNNKGITYPNQEEETSVGREDTYAHVTCDACVREEEGASSPDKDIAPNVIPLRLRGVR